jgi:hypothetical protein
MIGADLHNPSTVTYMTPTGRRRRRRRRRRQNK